MPVPYPLPWPSYAQVVSCDLFISRNQAILQTESRNIQVQRRDGDRWQGVVTLAPMVEPVAQRFSGWLTALNGRSGTFVMPHPDFHTPNGAAVNGQGRVMGSGQLGDTLETDGWPPSTLVLVQGDLIQVGTQLKQVMADVVSDGSGQASILIGPPFYKSPADNAPIIVENCAGLFRLGEVDIARPSDFMGEHRFTIPVYEAAQA